MNVENHRDRAGKSGHIFRQFVRFENSNGSRHSFDSPRRSIYFFSFSAVKFLFVIFVSSQIYFAQDILQDVAPPPLKIMSKEEKARLDAATEVKMRTKLALELMEARLLTAETFHTEEKYREMFTELGSFHALMDNTLDFLEKSDTNKGKVLNNFKRVELSLRKYVTRLELIRRDLPFKYELYVRKLVKYVRDARGKAMEPMFDDTVLPGDKPN